MENNEQNIPKKKSVILLFFLSLITFGIYDAIWYIKRSKEFENLNTQSKLSKKLTIFFLILVILVLIIKILNFFSYTSKLGTTTAAIILLISITFLIVLLFLRFRSRTILNQALEKKGVTRKVSWFFTLIFGFLYLQYEINRIIENREYEKRVGPWVIFLTLIIITIVSFVITGLIIMNKVIPSHLGTNLNQTFEKTLKQGKQKIDQTTNNDIFADCVKSGGTITTKTGTCSTGKEKKVLGGEYCCI